MLDTDKTRLFATVLFYGAILVVGPIFVEEAELDLGGGISMAQDGQIRVSNAPPVAAMRIPEDEEIGIVGQASGNCGATADVGPFVSCDRLSSPAH